MSSWFLEQAMLPDGLAADVVVQCEDGRISEVRSGIRPPAGAEPLGGLVLPGLANAHSHAFHRALRGRVAGGAADFWGWREQMYAVAARLEPDTYFELARAVYAEMALAGITAVGEFHYVHHRPDGSPYDDRNAMSEVLIAAARGAGIRLTLLDTCYLSSGFGDPPRGAQIRFSDGSGEEWRSRVEELDAPDVVVGAAIHSVRAVGPADAAVVASWAATRSAPLHFHLSEQPAENADCEAKLGMSPTAFMHEAGALGRGSTAVHATHLGDEDLAILARAGTSVCLCPTTERELGDGVGSARRFEEAGVPLSLGTDGQSVIDILEEARLTDLHERLVGGPRGGFGVDEMFAAATRGGMLSIGRDAGEIAPGRLADFTSIRLDSIRTAGAAEPLAAVLLAASAADVSDVIVGGAAVVRGGEHLAVNDPAGAMASAVTAVTG